jgi:hypothetical protein
MVMQMVVAVRLQHVSTRLRQDDDGVSMTIQPLRPDETFVAEMSQVARARIGGAIVVITQVA